MKGVADGKSWQWLRGRYLAKSTEAYLFAAQEQALRTRFLRATIEGEDVDLLCRVCGEAVESVGHLASGCGGWHRGIIGLDMIGWVWECIGSCGRSTE